MPYTYPEIRNFSGLHLQANSFEVPDGALEDAKNAVMTKDAILSKRRGFYEYLDPGGDSLNALVSFDSKLMAFFNNGVAALTDTGDAPNETATRTDLSGVSVSISGTRTSRSAESNKNLYFTTDNGVFKLESATSAIFNSGIPPALDLRGLFLAANGPILGGSSTSDGGQVAYRVIFGRRDANSNLLLGAPSDILGLSNAKTVGASWTRTSSVVTISGLVDHNIITGMQVEITLSSSGSPNITLTTYTVTGTTATTITFAEAVADSSGTCDFAVTRKPRLEFSIPSEITIGEEPFVQVYRSSQTIDVDTSPSSDFKLVTERSLTATEVSNGFATYDDGIDDILLGAELYTNPNSREGELQANTRAPLCDDITLYKEHVFYAKTTSRHLINLDVIDSTTMADGSYIEIQTVGSTVRRYVGRIGVGNRTVAADSVAGTTTITVTYAGHDFAVGDTVFISNVTGTLTEALYTLTGVAASTFTFEAAAGETATACDFQGVSTLLSGTLYPMFHLDIGSSSLAVRLRNTAQGIVKAINRDSSSDIYAQYTSGITGTPGKMRFEAKGFGGAIQIRAESVAIGAGFSPALTLVFGDNASENDDQPNALYIGKLSEPEAVPRTNFILVGARNRAILRVQSLRDSLIVVKADGVFRITGDAVGNFVATALDETVVCIASNSVATINNQVALLSNQGFCLVTENSVQIISRIIEDVIQPIVGLSTLATATAATAFETERLYLCSTQEPGATGTAPTVTYAYNILNGSWTSWDEVFNGAAIGPNDELHTITTLNKLNRQRKKQTKVDFAGQNYTISVTAKEEITDVGSGWGSTGWGVFAFGAPTAGEIITTKLTITVPSGVIPARGWVLILGGIINRITAVEANGTDSYIVSIPGATTTDVTGSGWGLDAWGEFEWSSPAPILYAGYETRIKLAPYHAGLVGRFKQFSQMQVHQRGAALSGLDISFGGASSETSSEVVWASLGVSSDLGWGLGFWGEFGWGNEEGIAILTGTQPGAIVRVYVPIRQQRTTFLQPILEHVRAAEEMNLQAVSFAVRAFQERVSR